MLKRQLDENRRSALETARVIWDLYLSVSTCACSLGLSRFKLTVKLDAPSGHQQALVYFLPRKHFLPRSH